MSQTSANLWNVPNTLTLFRIIFAVLMFVALEFGCYWGGMTFFIIAAITDYFDGWWARKFQQVTVFGRIVDPFADKLLVCGALIYLAAAPQMTALPWGFRCWMAVVIIGRELLITTIRAFLEQQGQDFSAKWAGKVKMGLQCVAIPACMLWIALVTRENAADNAATGPGWLYWLIVITVWGMVIVTIYSGLKYLFVASKIIFNGK